MVKKKKPKRSTLGLKYGGLKRSVRALKKKVSRLKTKRKARVKVVRAPARDIRITVAEARSPSRKAKRMRVGKAKPKRRPVKRIVKRRPVKKPRKRFVRKRARKSRVQRKPKSRVARVSGYSGKVAALEREIRLLNSRFREHLDELRNLPALGQEEKLEEIHKRLDEHERHGKHLQASVEDIQSSPGRQKNVDELAHGIVGLYFREIARHGFKRSLNLEDTFHAYAFVRKKLVEHKNVSAAEIEQAIKEQKQ